MKENNRRFVNQKGDFQFLDEEGNVIPTENVAEYLQKRKNEMVEEMSRYAQENESKDKDYTNLDNNIKYYMREKGGIVRYDGYKLCRLDQNGNWINDSFAQYAIVDMFIEKTDDYEEISEEEVQNIIDDRKNCLLNLKK